MFINKSLTGVLSRTQRQQRQILNTISKRSFAQLVNYETSQPPPEGSTTDYHLDSHMANSKYYNPHHFDPASLDYQNDIRLATRDEQPTDPDLSDITESLYAQIFHTELLYPPIFFGGWAAFEPDVSIYYLPINKSDY